MKNIISNLITDGNPVSHISPCPRPQFSTVSPLHDKAGVFLHALKSFVMFFRTILLVLLMLLPSCAGARVLAKDYLHIVKKTSNASIDNIMKKADYYFNAGHPDTALVYYMVVCNRMNDKLPDKDKRQCALAYLRMYFILKAITQMPFLHISADYASIMIAKLSKKQVVFTTI